MFAKQKILNNTICDIVDVESHHMFSDAQYDLLTSQNYDIKNIPQQKARIIEKADDMMNSLRIILHSNNVEQEFKDEAFPKHKITSLIDNLIKYDNENIAIQERNKQAIVLDLMQQCLRYFQDRYKEVFITKEIKVFEQFAKDITAFTENQIEESKAQELFKTRDTLQPPLLYPRKGFWKALCMECHRYTELGKTEDEAITRIRHSKNCSIHKEKKRLGKYEKERIKIQYYKIIPPLKK